MQCQVLEWEAVSVGDGRGVCGYKQIFVNDRRHRGSVRFAVPADTRLINGPNIC